MHTSPVDVTNLVAVRFRASDHLDLYDGTERTQSNGMIRTRILDGSLWSKIAQQIHAAVQRLVDLLAA
ncbi:MAG: hypothetical protein DMG00_10415 [Acidobacteria bacterium]|nr:MAG: hypothetical protein DMG00_10415 [Acidobacteriota bacterium]